MQLVSVGEMRALEARAVAQGTPEAELQARAAVAVGAVVYDRWTPGTRCVVLVGRGNNGRDGFLAGEWLQARGVPVDLVLVPEHAVTPAELRRAALAGLRLVASADRVTRRTLLAAAGIAVDALLGIGVRLPLRPAIAELVGELNDVRAQTGLHVVALDVPTGVDADTGAVDETAVVQADTTVTLGAIKQGLLRMPGAAQVGELRWRSIELPADDTPAAVQILDPATLPDLVPVRGVDAHKYRAGRVLVVAGTAHYPGAAVLCATAAARAGAGLVTLAASPELRQIMACHQPAVTYTEPDVSATNGRAAAVALEPYLQSHETVVLGPGLGRGPEVTEFVAEVLSRRPREHRLILDADGLVALAELPEWPSRLDANVILTPHSGELARLRGQPLDSAELPWADARRLAQQWGCVLVAKGPWTTVAAPDGSCRVWPVANPGLATGGTGDVLAGTIGSLAAQGAPPADAAALGVGIHALAAQRVLASGWRTLLASDLPPRLPAVLGELIRRR